MSAVDHDSAAVVGAADGPGAKAAGRPRLVFAVVSIGLFMASIDQTIVATALPAIERDLRAPINWSGWTISIYALGQVIAMPMAGKISDMYGRKKVYMIAAAVFTLSSLACGFARSMPLLLLPRFIQALGGGAFMPSATGIVADHFGRERDRAVGMITSILPVGGMIGPVIGGVFVSYWSWRGIFLVNVPIGILLVALTARFIPASATRPATRIDLPGICILTALIVTAMFGSRRGRSSDGASPYRLPAAHDRRVRFRCRGPADDGGHAAAPGVRLAGDCGGPDRLRDGPVGARSQQRQPAAGP